MENFRIDFTLSNPFPDGKKLGECGEKNAAQLIITPPENLASREEIRFYVVAFSTEKGPVRYGPVSKSATVTVPVSKALTVGTAISVQVEGYDADGEFIIKSPVLSGIVVSASISDGNCGNSDEESVIPGHRHDNLDLLDSFSIKKGMLLYKNTLISNVETNFVRECELSSESNSFFVMTDTPYLNCLIIITYRDSEGNLFVPDGALIRKIEVNLASADSPEWIDIHDMNDSDSITPYMVNAYKGFYSEEYKGTIIATVYYPYDFNKLYNAASSYDICSVRVTYEESGEK